MISVSKNSFPQCIRHERALTYGCEVFWGHAGYGGKVISRSCEKGEVLLKLKLGEPGMDNVEVLRPVRVAPEGANGTSRRWCKSTWTTWAQMVARGATRVQRCRRMPRPRTGTWTTWTVPAWALCHINTCWRFIHSLMSSSHSKYIRVHDRNENNYQLTYRFIYNKDLLLK